MLKILKAAFIINDLNGAKLLIHSDVCGRRKKKAGGNKVLLLSFQNNWHPLSIVSE